MADERHKVNLALQGGGSHGAFTWGVLDRLLEEQDLEFPAISGTSAGAMNAIVMAEGLVEGSRDKAREKLENFWMAIADAVGIFAPVQRMLLEQLKGNSIPGAGVFYETALALAETFSPNQLNPFNYNPLRATLERMIDFERVRRQKRTHLFINTTQVRTGNLRCWREHELDAEKVLASACLPWLFPTQMIGGEGYWDGGYVANPAIAPMMAETTTDDVLIVQLNPVVRNRLPRTAFEIQDRLNEITMNASLLTELRFIAEHNRLIDDGELVSNKSRPVHLHMIHDDKHMRGYPPSTKLLAERGFLLELRDLGRKAAEHWLKKHSPCLGVWSSLNYRRLVSRLSKDHDEEPDLLLMTEEE